MEVLDEVHYLKPGIGYFPALQGKVKHGFSWGEGVERMDFSKGMQIEPVKARIEKFLNDLTLPSYESSVNIIPEHSDRILFLKSLSDDVIKKTKVGLSVDCDAAFTTQGALTLTVKPSDCTTAIVYCERKDKKPVIGLIHTGRKGVNLELPKKTIKFLMEELGCEVNNILLAIVPQLSTRNRTFDTIQEFDNPGWEQFMTKDEKAYYPDECGFALKQYRDSGIKDENILLYNIDTFEATSKGQAFSYKYNYEMRKVGKSERPGSFIVAVG